MDTAGPGRDSPWDRNSGLLNEHLEGLQQRLETFASGHGGFCTGEDEFAPSDLPLCSRTMFFDEIELAVEFHREGSRLRYVSRIERGRSTLREGPGGLIDVSAPPARQQRPARCTGRADLTARHTLARVVCWKPAGTVTRVLAMLSAVGGSHCTSVTVLYPVCPPDPPKVCVEPVIRTGR